MTHETKAQASARLTAEMLEAAEDAHKTGVLDDAAYRRITMRQFERMEAAVAGPLTGDEIRQLREQANMSQAVFARVVGVTPDHISKLERGQKQPLGSALVLLNVIRRHGIELIMH